MREIREPEDAIDKRDTERAERQLAAIGKARHQDEIGKDATRKVVMRQFKRFGEDFYPRMQEMFLNREGADATAPAVTGSDEAAGENNDDDPDEGQANPGGQK